MSIPCGDLYKMLIKCEKHYRHPAFPAFPLPLFSVGGTLLAYPERKPCTGRFKVISLYIVVWMSKVKILFFQPLNILQTPISIKCGINIKYNLKYNISS